MAQPKDTVATIHFKGYTNTQCEFLPCHKKVQGEFNCLFCYCPLVFLECPGPFAVFKDKHGQTRKDCSNCKLPHDGYEKSWNFIQKALEHPVPWNGQWAMRNMRIEDILSVKKFQDPASSSFLEIKAFDGEEFYFLESSADTTQEKTSPKLEFLKNFKHWHADAAC